MKCPSCNKDIRTKNVKFCPYCGKEISNPQKVSEYENIEIDNGKTIAIKKASLKEEPIVEEIKEEKQEFVNNVLESNESQNSRRKIFCLVGSFILTILLIGILFITLYSSASSNDKNFSYNYKEVLEEAFNDYYNDGNKDKINEILEHLSNDHGNVYKVQDAAYTRFKNDLDVILLKEYDNLEDFNKEVEKYKKIEEDLYDITCDDIHIFSSGKHDDLKGYIERSYDNTKNYYDALDNFNSRDYNKAYKLFDTINEDNVWYSRSNNYKNVIINNIIALIKNDITKLESGIDKLSKLELLQRYKQIENIILKYPDIYYEVPLKNNVTYVDLLSKYTGLVNEYTKLLK